jgi:predicted membrane protein
MRLMTGRNVLGLLLILLGLGFLLDQVDVLNPGDILGTWWPLILVAAGVAQLYRRAWVEGAILVLFGGVLQAWRLELLPGDVWHYLWPTAIIAIGLWLLSSTRGRNAARVQSKDRLDEFAVLGNIENRNESVRFEGGRITALLASVEIDLTRAKLAAEGARLEASAVLGSITLRVPQTWNVAVTGTPLLGSVENKARRDPQAADRPALQIEVTATLGSVEVRD